MSRALALALLAGCTEKKAEPLSSLAPKPLPTLEVAGSDARDADREALHRVEAAPVYGEKVPRATRLELSEDSLRVGSEAMPIDGLDAARLAGALGKEAVVLIAPDSEFYLARAAPLLAALEDARAEVQLLHPGGEVAYPVALFDEPRFQAWLDEVKAGKIRVIQRADGFELQTGMGKLAGPDPNGPSVPLRGGKLDIATLRRGLQKLKGRFDTAEDMCFVPSFGTELAKVAEAMSANYQAMGQPIFEQTCLVYPRPRG
ncbi:MAG: hypothetical protein HYZ28_25530 [Myxococcales bacterium]|nr:hypothetical protein [Myxococcales bacterium]